MLGHSYREKLPDKHNEIMHSSVCVYMYVYIFISYDRSSEIGENSLSFQAMIKSYSIIVGEIKSYKNIMRLPA